MSWYLHSRPGRPLHLVVWAADRLEHQEGKWWTSGRPVPLCGSDRGHPDWRYTGPATEAWERDRKAGLCKKCASRLDALCVDAVNVANNDTPPSPALDYALGGAR